jgi:ABC-type bacteriocin/lantibiotic exporter with double-glycine peptidase domain
MANGIRMTEKELAGLMQTNISGTNYASAVFVMERLGFIARKFHVKDSDPRKIEAPAMIFVDHPATGPESHAVGYMGFHAGKAEIWDPLEGKKFMTQEELSETWHGRGVGFKKK